MRTHSISSDATFNGLSFVVRAVGIVVVFAWVARVLGPEGQGRFGLSHWVAAGLAQLAVWGLGVACSRFVAREMGAGSPARAAWVVRRTGRRLAASLAAALTLYAAGVLWLGNDLEGPLWAALPLVAGVATNQWRMGVAVGLRRFDLVFYGHLVFFVVVFPALAIGLAGSEPVVGALLAFGAAKGAQAGFVVATTHRALAPVLGKDDSPEEECRESLNRELGVFTFEVGLLAAVSVLLWDRPEVLLLKLEGSYDDIGFYTAAFGISALVLRVPSVLSLVVLPVIASMEGARASAELIGAACRRAARLMTLALATPTAVLIVVAPTVVGLVYGDSFEPAGPVLQVLLLPLVLGGLGGPASKTLLGAGFQRPLLGVVVLSTGLKALLCVALIPSMGVLGAALGVAVGQGIGLAGEAVLAWRLFPVSTAPSLARWTGQAVVAGGAAGAAWLVGVAAAGLALPALLLLVLQCGSGAVAGLVLARLCRPIEEGDLRALEEELPPGAWRWCDPILSRLAAAPESRG